MVRQFILIAACLASSFVKAQNDPVLSISPGQLTEQEISLNIPIPGIKSKVPCSVIKIIDKRYDTYKVGFLPFYKSFPKLIRLNYNLPDWIDRVIQSSIQRTENEQRNLLIVIKKFWFGHEAYQKFSAPEVVLYYNLEIYSVTNNTYYPIKRVQGNFKTHFNEGSYKQLGDSLSAKLQKDILSINYLQKEVPANSLDSAAVFDYYKKRLERIPQRYEIPTGVFSTYEDFLQRKVITDSVDVIKYYDYFLKTIISCRIGIFVNGQFQPCNNCWGYYSGVYLYVNTGKGLFVKLSPLHDQFILADMLRMAVADDKNGIYDNGKIGNSTYENIKSVSRIYQLFYQLDYDEGKLF